MKQLPAAKLAETLDLEPKDSALFEYIAESYVNGQFSQVKKLFNQLEDHSKHNFIGWAEDYNWHKILGLLLRDRI